MSKSRVFTFKNWVFKVRKYIYRHLNQIYFSLLQRKILLGRKTNTIFFLFQIHFSRFLYQCFCYFIRISLRLNFFIILLFIRVLYDMRMKSKSRCIFIATFYLRQGYVQVLFLDILTILHVHKIYVCLYRL